MRFATYQGKAYRLEVVDGGTGDTMVPISRDAHGVVREGAAMSVPYGDESLTIDPTDSELEDAGYHLGVGTKSYAERARRTDPSCDPDKEGVIRDGNGRTTALKGLWGWAPLHPVHVGMPGYGSDMPALPTPPAPKQSVNAKKR